MLNSIYFFNTYVASGDSLLAFQGLQDAMNQFDEQMVIRDAGFGKIYKTMMQDGSESQ